MKNITLVNPPLVLSRNDVFTTGIVYMPVSLACFAGYLQRNGHSVSVIDAFGLNPNRLRSENGFIIRGLSAGEACDKIARETSAVFVYARSLASHRATLGIIKSCKTANPSIPVIAVENTQAATSYSLETVQEEFYAAGADYILTGEPEERGLKLLESLLSGVRNPSIDGIGFRENGRNRYLKPENCVQNLDELPYPAWELFPLGNYWDLHYAHGPLSSRKYLPVITSRGCPYSCNFCVVPALNGSKWRALSARRVADELAYLEEKFDVREFHLEDVNPTVDDERTKQICSEIISRNLEITWKICAGTKVETIKSTGTVELMAKAGCRYISISPESGSETLMKAMNKPFDTAHAAGIVQKAKKLGIYLQACFVLGYPGETARDREKSAALAKTLVKAGVDEIAVFIITPAPGSRLFGEIRGYTELSQLNFSPSWRNDFKELAAFRLKLYLRFLLWKLAFHPFRLLKQPLCFIFRRFNTKMEMAPYRALHILLLLIFARRCK